MAQYRQSGMDRSGVCGQEIHPDNGSTDQFSIGIRASSQAYHKGFRHRRSYKLRNIPFTVVSFTLSLVLSLSIMLAFYFLPRDPEGTNSISHLPDDDIQSGLTFLRNATRTDKFKILRFGNGSVAHGWDSRYWDRDDRRRDGAYDGETMEHFGHEVIVGNKSEKISDDSVKVSNHIGVGLYKEPRRDEPKMHEAEYDPSLKIRHDNLEIGRENAVFSVYDEYDDGFGFHDLKMDSYEDRVQSSMDVNNAHDGDSMMSLRSLDKKIQDRLVSEDGNSFGEDVSSNYLNKQKISGVNGQSIKKLNSEMQFELKKKAKRRKFSGSTCVMKLLNSTAQLVEPIESPKFVRFSLHYTDSEENPLRQEDWEPRFAGHQTLAEREISFLAKDQKINCGFVNGPKGTPSTGFDLAEDDRKYISTCHIAVISCIFGNSDRLRSPTGKSVTHQSRKNVCFVMFMDEITLQTLSSEGQRRDSMGFVGLWRIVVVKNLPYTDMRRVGKIPKLLSHRLFPSARYSIWLDSKLRLQVDPILILEYLLWRKGYEFAISNHYDRHCLWEEVAQNKKLNKYNHTIIDQQFSFYQADGLKRFNASDPNKLLPSNVPEGSFIVRAHTPMSCLFSCLWFNEVERFTPRDQLSFAYTYQKLKTMNPTKTFRLNMFKDCERRGMAKLFHHRLDEKRRANPSPHLD